LFSCGVDTLAARKSEGFDGGGIWSVETDHTCGPYDVDSAAIVTTAPLYSGRLIRSRAGQWIMMACHDATGDGSFDGVVSDPLPVHWDAKRGCLATVTTQTKA
jgi:beta-fructofuranosidase